MPHDEIEIEKVKFPIKTVVVIVLWVGSLMGVYYKMQESVDKAQNMAIEALTISKDVQAKFTATNISLLTYRVDELTTSVKDLQKTANEVKDLVRTMRQ
jgi:hypothetical protein